MKEITISITPADIKSKFTDFEQDRSDNRIRKAWVLQTPENEAKKMQALPQEVKFALYAGIDYDVRAEWIVQMREYSANAIADGAKMVFDPISGIDILEKAYRHDPDVLLIKAAGIVMARLMANAGG